MSKTFVVVPTYNGARFIAAALRSVLGQVKTPSDIVVVDNHSSDDTPTIVCREFPLVRLEKLPNNIGFGQAANIGLQIAVEAGAEFAFLLNQDVVVEEDALSILVAEIAASPGLGLLSALQLTYDGRRVDPTFRRYAGEQFWDDLLLGTPRSCYRVPYMPTAAVLIRRQALADIKGFDSLFFMYGEDDDLCRRLAEAGWSVGFARNARVRHWHGLLNARPSWGWQLNWEYSRAVLHLRSSPRPLPVAFLSLLSTWTLPSGPEFRAVAARVVAFMKCLCCVNSIRREARGRPEHLMWDNMPKSGRGIANSTMPDYASDPS
jgi:GT2 family glycosyltransferase